MTVAWLIYAIAVGLMLAHGAWLLDHAAGVAQRARRWIWVAAIGACFALAVVAVVETGQPPRLRSTSVVAAPFRIAGAALTASSRRLAPVLSRFDRFVPAFVLSASAAMATFSVIACLRLRRLRNEWSPAWIDGTPILVSGSIGPAVAGVIRPRIVLPEWVLGLPDGFLGLLLAHERSHQIARDPLLIHSAGVALIAMPWNPAVWWMVSRLRLAIELDCDARVLRGEGSGARAAYSQLLIEVAARRTHRAFVVPALLERPSILARRIAAMTPIRFRFAAARVWLSSVIAVLLLAGAMGLPAPVTAQQKEFGQGAYKASDKGITLPKVIKSVDPAYTTAAKEKEIQGTVLLEAVVQTDGNVGDVRVTKSLDKQYGLDASALDAARRWKFDPATRDGEKVAVVCQIEMEFRLR